MVAVTLCVFVFQPDGGCWETGGNADGEALQPGAKQLGPDADFECKPLPEHSSDGVCQHTAQIF